jgi:hypothetical protein
MAQTSFRKSSATFIQLIPLQTSRMVLAWEMVYAASFEKVRITLVSSELFKRPGARDDISSKPLGHVVTFPICLIVCCKQGAKYSTNISLMKMNQMQNGNTKYGTLPVKLFLHVHLDLHSHHCRSDIFEHYVRR